MSLTGDYGSGWKAAQCDVLKTCELRYFTKDISSDELLVDGCLVFSRSEGEAVAPVATCNLTLHMYSMYIAALTKKCFDHRIFTMEIGIDM